MRIDWKQISRENIIGDRSQGENFTLLNKLIHKNNLHYVIISMEAQLEKFKERNPSVSQFDEAEDKIQILREVAWWMEGLHHQKEICEKLSYRDHICNLALEAELVVAKTEIESLKKQIHF